MWMKRYRNAFVLNSIQKSRWNFDEKRKYSIFTSTGERSIFFSLPQFQPLFRKPKILREIAQSSWRWSVGMSASSLARIHSTHIHAVTFTLMTNPYIFHSVADIVLPDWTHRVHTTACLFYDVFAHGYSVIRSLLLLCIYLNSNVA